MNKRTILVITLSAMFLIIPVSDRILAPGQIEQWVPFVPRDVYLEFWTENQTSYVKAAITFYTGGYNISDWGTIIRNNCDFHVNSEIWRWTGPVIQIVWTARYIYELGQLEKGNYTFTFSAWSQPVKTLLFSIGFMCDVNYDGKVDMKDVAIVALAFGSYPSHSRWSPIADINGDNKIDMKDIGVIAKEFGKTY